MSQGSLSDNPSDHVSDVQLTTVLDETTAGHDDSPRDSDEDSIVSATHSRTAMGAGRSIAPPRTSTMMSSTAAALMGLASRFGESTPMISKKKKSSYRQVLLKTGGDDLRRLPEHADERRGTDKPERKRLSDAERLAVKRAWQMRESTKDSESASAAASSATLKR